MNNAFNNITILGLLGPIEMIFKIFMYMAIISVSFKAIQALNIYINKNNRP